MHVYGLNLHVCFHVQLNCLFMLPFQDKLLFREVLFPKSPRVDVTMLQARGCIYIAVVFEYGCTWFRYTWACKLSMPWIACVACYPNIVLLSRTLLHACK